MTKDKDRFNITSEVSIMIRDNEDFEAMEEVIQGLKDAHYDFWFELWKYPSKPGGELHIDWSLSFINDGPKELERLAKYIRDVGTGAMP